MSLTVDNNTVHYLEQQAPQPVVRPLTRLTSDDKIAEYIVNSAPNEDGDKSVIGSWEFEKGKCAPIEFWLSKSNVLSVYQISCDDTHNVNSSGISNEKYITELPCYATELSLDSNTLMKKVANAGGFETDESATSYRKDYENRLMTFIIPIE